MSQYYVLVCRIELLSLTACEYKQKILRDCIGTIEPRIITLINKFYIWRYQREPTEPPIKHNYLIWPLS